jgi:hypothetical protein
VSVVAGAAGDEELEEGQLLGVERLFKVTKAWPPLCFLPFTNEQVAKRQQERLKWLLYQ